MEGTRKPKIFRGGARRPKIVFSLSLMFAIVVGSASYFKEDGIRMLISQDKKLRKERAFSLKLEEENGRLARKIKSIHDDSYLVEKFAREKLNLVQEGEIVFRFYDDASRGF